MNLNPLDPAFWSNVAKLGPWPFVVVVLVVGLLVTLYFSMRQQAETTKRLQAQTAADMVELKSITDKFISFMETHITAETKALQASTEAIKGLCENCHQHQEILNEHFKASVTEHARVITAVETNRSLILSALPGKKGRRG